MSRWITSLDYSENSVLGDEGSDAWKFSLDACPVEKRVALWRENMGRICLPIGEIPAEESFYGSVSYHKSSLGMEFSLVDSAAHEISGRYLEQSDAVWLIVVLDGQGKLLYDDECQDLESGDIAYGPCRRDATIRFNVNFRVLHVRIPRLTLSARVLTPLLLNIGVRHTCTGIDHVFLGMLRALSETLDTMTTSDLRPVELALTEFLIGSLRDEPAAFGLEGAAGVRSSLFHSICQSIETMLSDPDISLAYVAKVNKISTRYLQKLFAGENTSFSYYLRSRRLERCRADLRNPVHSQLSISEICFRWGFNGSAHFSRVFRTMYSVCPREYRYSDSQVNMSL